MQCLHAVGGINRLANVCGITEKRREVIPVPLPYLAHARIRIPLVSYLLQMHPLRNTIDVSALLAETINQVRRGVVDPRVANCMGQLASVMLRSLEQGPMEIRMARLETALDIAKDP